MSKNAKGPDGAKHDIQMMTLASIKACAISMENELENEKPLLSDDLVRELDQIYKDILKLSQVVVWGQQP